MTPKEFMDNFGTLADAPGGIKKLRELLLELAAKGKLTRPLDTDEPVGILQDRIRREREKAVRDGIAAKLVDVPPVDGDAPFEIPERWAWVKWGTLTLYTESGWSPQADARPRQLPEWGVLKVSAVSWDVFKPEENKALPPSTKPPERAVVRPGDFLISRANTAELVGRSVLVDATPERLILSDKIIRCEFAPSVERRYINYLNRTSAARTHYAANATGTSDSMRNISRDVILNVPVPLPPLPEQKRIVAKVDQLMALLDDLEAKQDKRQRTVGRATAACLDALTTADGPKALADTWKRLASNWRVLLDRPEAVDGLRLALMDIASTGKLTSRSSADGSAVDAVGARRSMLRAKKIATDPFRDEAEPESLPALPPGWAYEALGRLGLDPSNPVQTGPFGAQLHQKEFVQSGVPVIAVGNLTGTGFTTEGIYFITKAKAEQLARYDVNAGDLLFARSGATTGKVCVAPACVRDWRMTGHILRVRLEPTLLLPQIAVYWLWGATAVKQQVVAGIRGGTRPGYNTSLLARIVLPLPPLPEQRRIVTKINDFMALCDDLDAKLRARDDRAGRLVEAVVGEMVAPSEAPISARQESEVMTPASKPPRAKPRSPVGEKAADQP